MGYDRNRVYCWRYRGLTGIERTAYDVAISFGLPSKPEASTNEKFWFIWEISDKHSANSTLNQITLQAHGKRRLKREDHVESQARGAIVQHARGQAKLCASGLARHEGDNDE